MVKNFFLNLKEKLTKSKSYEGTGEDYVHVDDSKEEKGKVIVRPFMLDTFEDVKPILDSLREGYTIALINIRPLKEKDIIELKRAINKLRKTCDAIEGDLAGFGEDYIVAVPYFASIHRTKETVEAQMSEAGEGEEES